MCPVIAYHATFARNRLSIFRRGLLARDTCGPKGNYPGCSLSENRGVQAVYLTWSERGWWTRIIDTRPLDVWAVNILGLPTEPDPIVHKAIRVRQDVPRERLSLHAKEVE